MANDGQLQAKVQAFIARWAASQASERANHQPFVIELCELLELPRPEAACGDLARDRYVFERRVDLPSPEDKPAHGFIDLYKAGAFVLEAKQGADGPGFGGVGRRETPSWHAEMQKAHGQALAYAKSLEEPPPFVVVCDVGYCFDLYAQFDGSGVWRPFPTAQQRRLYLKQLVDPAVRETLRGLFLDPHALDPSKRATRITREVAGKLADLAKVLEKSGHHPEHVAKFLMRCVFTMFAEDVQLLPPALFRDQIEKRWLKDPESFPREVRELWEAMDSGDRFGFGGRLLRFNGGLFKGSFALPLTREQLQLLLDCANCDWSQVEPSIFGTLLERALSPAERHKLGAHYTPRAYVERLVRPTIEEPLREEWDAILVAVHKAQEGGKAAQLKKARAQVVEFHTRLCHTRVLDPACGTGNFLYVAFDLFKRLEGEVLAVERELTGEGESLGIEGLQISPAQFLGIEVKFWAKQIAELVLWIGYLQWHFRTKGSARPEEPVLREYDNIQCRDAVLEWDGDPEPALDEKGKPLTRWDGVTTKLHPVTGKEVPDETARVPVLTYKNPRPAKWPEADFIVGNPPFIGNKRMRDALGDGYVEALRKAHKDVPGSVDFVMYWWERAAASLRRQRLRRFGFITTNSLTQTYNRSVLTDHLRGSPPLSLRLAIPNHPWVDCSDGAQVRIAMTVAGSGELPGKLLRIREEREGDDDAHAIEFEASVGRINSDLSIGHDANTSSRLQANLAIACPGVQLSGQGFIVAKPDLGRFTKKTRGALIRPYMIGSEIMKARRESFVIDAFGLTETELKRVYPDAYQWLYLNVRPQRLQATRETYSRNWWVFSEPRAKFRPALRGLTRFIATCRTAKHRVFVFVPPNTTPETTIVVIAIDDAFFLGCLSSVAHTKWALRVGTRLGVGDDPRYNHADCFNEFPFPAATESQKAKIRALGEELDAHRKRQQAEHPTLTITGMYNVLEKLRKGEPLTAKEKVIHEQGLVSVLKDIHDRLDAAVFKAYGWPAELSDEEIIAKLVALNAERAEEEKKGLVRWLRPEFQNPKGAKATQTALLPEEEEEEAGTPAVAPAVAWPKSLPERMTLVRDTVVSCGAVSAAEVAKALRAKKSADVVEVLDGLAMLGHLAVTGEGSRRRWAAAGRR